MAPQPRSPLLLVTTPPPDAPAGSYLAIAREGQQRLAAELSGRLERSGATVQPLVATAPEPDRSFHWGRWFVTGARSALAERPEADAIGYAGGGALALIDDESLGDLLTPGTGEVVANNRFSADAFVLAGDLPAALAALEECESDNAAPRRLEEAGMRVRDLGSAPFARFDVDTPLDLALLRLATRLPGPRRPEDAMREFLDGTRLPSNGPLEVPRLEEIGAVMRDRRAELVVAGRVPAASWQELETETACRVRCFVEERGMRSAPGSRPRSLLAAYAARTSPGELIAELASLGDAVILDTRVLMAALAGSPDAGTWPPPEERYASDFGDAAKLATPWLRELVVAAAAAPVPFLFGGHALVSDGLRLMVAAAWLGR